MEVRFQFHKHLRISKCVRRDNRFRRLHEYSVHYRLYVLIITIITYLYYCYYHLRYMYIRTHRWPCVYTYRHVFAYVRQPRRFLYTRGSIFFSLSTRHPFAVSGPADALPSSRSNDPRIVGKTRIHRADGTSPDTRSTFDRKRVATITVMC